MTVLNRLLCGQLAALLILTGCGDSGPVVVPVSGRITHQGKPVPDVSISFTPPSGRPSTGRADADGRFTLTYSEEKQGAEVGTHKVTVSYVAKDPGEEMEIVEGRKKHPPELTKILETYGTLESSPLSIEIKEPTTDLEVKVD